MFNNKRPYQVNHIPNKLNYLYLKQLQKTYTPNNKTFNYINTTKDCYENSIDNILLENNTNLFNDISLLFQIPIKNETSSNNRKTNKSHEIFEEKLERLEQQPFELFKPQIDDIDNLNFIYNFLYHGIRFQKHLEKLESIFRSRAILAGNYQDNYYSYSDNCNEGEYISLASIKNNYDLEYETFIMPNISLVISPKCNAIKTIYLPFEEWEKIYTKETKNRYSYAHNEYQVKQIIPVEMIKAIGLPAKYLRLTNQSSKVEIYQNDILELMKKYNIDLPIVDTSNYNKPLYLHEKYIPKRKTKIYR